VEAIQEAGIIVEVLMELGITEEVLLEVGIVVGVLLAVRTTVMVIIVVGIIEEVLLVAWIIEGDPLEVGMTEEEAGIIEGPGTVEAVLAVGIVVEVLVGELQEVEEGTEGGTKEGPLQEGVGTTGAEEDGLQVEVALGGMIGDPEVVGVALGGMTGDPEVVGVALGGMTGDTEVVGVALGGMTGDTEVVEVALDGMTGVPEVVVGVPNGRLVVGEEGGMEEIWDGVAVAEEAGVMIEAMRQGGTTADEMMEAIGAAGAAGTGEEIHLHPEEAAGEIEGELYVLMSGLRSSPNTVI
jgi:hypothetical protein